MSRLEELIREHCPDGVEYKKVKEVYTRLRGTAITAGKMKGIEAPDGEIRVFAGGKTAINAHEEDIPNANITRVPAVLVQSRGVIDVVYYEKPFTFKNEMWAYTAHEKTAVKFLYHVLKNNIPKFREAASGMGSLPQISLPVTEDFLIPVPPLPVQQEIVRILDNFTELTAELTDELNAELAARQRQYEYYRDTLLTFKDIGGGYLKDGKDGDEPVVQWLPLKELGTWRGGCTPSMANPKYWEGGRHPWVSSKDMKGTVLRDTQDHITDAAIAETPIKLLPRNIVAIVVRSGILKHTMPVVYIPAEVTVNQDIRALIPSETVLPRYAYHVLSGYSKRILAKAKKQGGTVDSLDTKQLMDFPVPVPPLAEQARIVAILDRFDALCNDLSSGLPAEIEARRRQYEYYRDKLLNFKELGA